jgi:hypothetical protein
MQVLGQFTVDFFFSTSVLLLLVIRQEAALQVLKETVID